MEKNIITTKKNLVISSISISIFTALIVLGVFSFVHSPQASNDDSSTQTHKSSIVKAKSYPDGTVVSAVSKANPAVVSIVVTKEVPVMEQYYQQVNPFGDMGMIGNNFNIQIPQYRNNGKTEKKEIGGGSGFFVSPDGYIVTNKHVVEDKDASYTVFTNNDEKKYTAKVVAVDPTIDIAILKVDDSSHNLPYLSFREENDLALGETAIAIGNALGEFRNSISVGVVSGLSRNIVAGDGYGGEMESLNEVIQTDAAINPGNSGGPLLDIDGKVIGVNVATVQGGQNIGFALPAPLVKSIYDSVEKYGEIVRPFLGVRYVLVTKELAEKNNLKDDYGALVQRGQNPEDIAVIPGSSADKAGIVENDILLEVDGEKITPENPLDMLLRNKKIGDTIKVKLNSKGNEKTVNVVLQKAK